MSDAPDCRHKQQNLHRRSNFLVKVMIPPREHIQEDHV